MRLVTLGIVAVLVAAGLAACTAAPPPTPTPSDPLVLGQQVFAQYCAPCHGADGEGFVNALDAPGLNADSEAHLLSDEAILSAVIDGGAADFDDDRLVAVLADGDDRWLLEHDAAPLDVNQDVYRAQINCNLWCE